MNVGQARDAGVTGADVAAAADLSVLPDVSDRAKPDAAPEADMLFPSDVVRAPDGASAPRCATQTVDPLLAPVSGTIRGPRLDGELCEQGLGTFFLGPDDLDRTYNQIFYTTKTYSVHDSALVYGFLFREPADAQGGDLSGDLDVPAAATGTYDSTTDCGLLDFVVTLPIPPDVVCTTEFHPCDPGCEGYGEMWVCKPAHATLHYAARSSATCAADQDPAQGNWQLTLTSVSPYIERTGYKHHETHGHLSATLVNQADPSDSVVVELDF
jgi:hypothetical protein